MRIAEGSHRQPIPPYSPSISLGTHAPPPKHDVSFLRESSPNEQWFVRSAKCGMVCRYAIHTQAQEGSMRSCTLLFLALATIGISGTVNAQESQAPRAADTAHYSVQRESNLAGTVVAYDANSKTPPIRRARHTANRHERCGGAPGRSTPALRKPLRDPHGRCPAHRRRTCERARRAILCRSHHSKRNPGPHPCEPRAACWFLCRSPRNKSQRGLQGFRMKRVLALVALLSAGLLTSCGGSGSSVTPPPPAGNFSNASLNGQYAFSMGGIEGRHRRLHGSGRKHRRRRQRQHHRRP